MEDVSAPRRALLDRLVARLAARDRSRPFRVAVDGRCGSGKTRFGQELATVLRQAGESVLRLDSDAFHHLSGHRRRRTDDPALGYYEDAYDLRALAQGVLEPLGRGERTIRTAVCDFAADRPAYEVGTVDEDAVVLFECTFVQRGVLRGLWDLVIMLDVSPAVAHSRAVERDSPLLGDRATAERLHRERYGAAWELYVAEEDPSRSADVVLGHDSPATPDVVRW